MIDELTYLDYYSSGFKLVSFSYSKKSCVKEKNKYINKEEVPTAKKA